MKDPFRDYAENILEFVNLMEAKAYVALAIVLFLVGGWLMFVVDNVVVGMFGLVLFICIPGSLAKAGEHYLRARPAEPPQERQQRLAARSLHMPSDRREMRRQRRVGRESRD